MIPALANGVNAIRSAPDHGWLGATLKITFFFSVFRPVVERSYPRSAGRPRSDAPRV